MPSRSEEHTSELQSQSNLVCRLLLEKKKRHIKTNFSLEKKKIGIDIMQALRLFVIAFVKRRPNQPFFWIFSSLVSFFFFFFIDPATTEIYTLSLHDALPIYPPRHRGLFAVGTLRRGHAKRITAHERTDRKSTRLNSSHSQISYAVFCLK